MAKLKKKRSSNIEDRRDEKPDAIRDTLRMLPDGRYVLERAGVYPRVTLKGKAGGSGLTPEQKAYKPPVSGLRVPTDPMRQESYEQLTWTLDKNGQLQTTTRETTIDVPVNARSLMASTKKKSSKALTEDEILAYTILGEAAGEGRKGMAAVMQVIKNRAESGRYPSSLSSVALQKSSKGTYQFTTWSSKHGNNPTGKYSKDSAAFKEALAIVQAVKSGAVPDITGGALHYYANSGAGGINEPWWFSAEAPGGAVQLGNHKFAAKTAPASAADYSQKLAAAMVGAPYPATMKVGGVASAVRFAPKIDYLPTPKSALQLSGPNTMGGPVNSRGAAGAAARNLFGGGSGLVSRKVQTVAIDPLTGQPTTKANAEAQAAVLRSRIAAAATGGTVRGVNDAIRDQRAEQLLVRQTARPTVTTANKTGRTNVNVETVHRDGTVTRQTKPGSVAMPADARPSILPKLPVPNLRLPQAPQAPAAKPVTKLVSGGTKYVTKKVATTIKVKNPNYKPGQINPAAVQKLQDIHDKKESAVMAAQGIPNLLPTEPEFIEKTIMVEKKVPIVMPPIEIVVAGGTPANVPLPQPRPVYVPPPMTPVQQLMQQGYSAADAYDEANYQARERARSGSGSTSGNIGGVSGSGRVWDYDRSEWVDLSKPSKGSGGGGGGNNEYLGASN